jgi:hypothetical protein
MTPPILLPPVEAYTVAAHGGPATPALGTDFAKLFTSRDDLRRAIILREVFGPPRSLQPLDLPGNA